MPQLVNFIEAIARERKQDVLLLVFAQRDASYPASGAFELPAKLRKQRADLVGWLDENGIGYQDCWHPGLKEDGVWMAMPHDGTIALDLAFDPTDERYQKFIARVELPDGTPRDKDVVCYLHLFDPAKKKPLPVEDW